MYAWTLYTPIKDFICYALNPFDIFKSFNRYIGYTAIYFILHHLSREIRHISKFVLRRGVNYVVLHMN